MNGNIASYVALGFVHAWQPNARDTQLYSYSYTTASYRVYIYLKAAGYTIPWSRPTIVTDFQIWIFAHSLLRSYKYAVIDL